MQNKYDGGDADEHVLWPSAGNNKVAKERSKSERRFDTTHYDNFDEDEFDIGGRKG